jgi:alpha-L-fucosidase
MDHPWEENRGMGFSFGYNRAERLEHYHTGRELVIMLVDLVSRGGNLLLDIGPAADGTIPVVMEERLLQIGAWLKVNGDAIYGTSPWSVTRQWSAGEAPKVEYNKEWQTAYDVTKLGGVEAFFTRKGNDVFAILPRWPRGTFRITGVTGVKAVMLLGSAAPVKFRAVEGGVSVDLPDLPEDLTQQAAWVLKLSR